MVPSNSDENGVDPLIGTLIDRRYRVLKRLGDGSMGTVYKVEHNYINKLFALKVMLPTKDEVDRKRFEQEARLASSIRHPNVVEISDFGVLPTDQPYFVMEFLRGNTVGDAILEEQLDSLLICHIAVQIASGLQAVHKQNIVHRDLKPDHIFLVDPDEHAAPAAEAEGAAPGEAGAAEESFVKIMDFGIAKSTDNKLTGTGMTVGTPEYMSPEQATGDRVDWRTDQYSMGCILYEMLTGFLPFEGRSAFEIMNKHLTEHPVPPRQRRPDRATEIPEGLEQIVLRLLSKDRNNRFANMRAVEQALREQAALLQQMRLSTQRTVVSPALESPPPDPAQLDGQRTVPLLLALTPLGQNNEPKTHTDLPVIPEGAYAGPPPQSELLTMAPNATIIAQPAFTMMGPAPSASGHIPSLRPISSANLSRAPERLLRRAALPCTGTALSGVVYFLFPQHPEAVMLCLFLTIIAMALIGPR